jgi:hypothetical protein
MNIVEIVFLYPETETVFRKHDDKAGACLCSQSLFDPLKNTAVWTW